MQLLTNNGVSASVSSVELLITIVLFIAVYAIILVAWARLISGFIKKGPVEDLEGNIVDQDGAAAIAGASAPTAAASVASDSKKEAN